MKPPQKDPNSIGAMLTKCGLDQNDLERARAYQEEHPDQFLGEICVRLGFISKDRLEIALHRQSAVRERKIGALLELAAARTRTMVASLGTMVAANEAVLDKLK